METQGGGALILDLFTLEVVFALTALTLLVLFFLSFRDTGSKYSFGWTAALLFLVVGSLPYLLIGTDQQIWAIPVANALTVVGLVWAWRAARSLRILSLSRWLFVLPALVAGVASLLDSPASNELAGAPVLSAVSAVLMGLAAREVFLLDADQYSRSRWSLLIASGLLSVYYLIRLVAALANDFGSALIAALVSEETTTVVTELVLIAVSFSMAGLSHDEVAQRLRARARRSSLELSEGAQVQANLLPERAPDIAGYPMAGICVPSRALSGDFFDWQQTDSGLVVTVGDVMGKGAGAAMLGATVRAGLRLARRQSPRATVGAMISALGSDLVRNSSFATLFHAHLDPQSGRLTVLDAGHGLAVIVRRDGAHEQISSINLPLGLNLDEIWDEQILTLETGDRLLVFSDGVLDLFDGSLASLDRAADLALATDGKSSPSVQDAVDRIEALALAGEREDDVTVVVIERVPQLAPVALG